jgi:hypothetical protein
VLIVKKKSNFVPTPCGVFFECKGLHKKRLPQSSFVGIFARCGLRGQARGQVALCVQIKREEAGRLSGERQ